MNLVVLQNVGVVPPQSLHQGIKGVFLLKVLKPGPDNNWEIQLGSLRILAKMPPETQSGQIYPVKLLEQSPGKTIYARLTSAEAEAFIIQKQDFYSQKLLNSGLPAIQKNIVKIQSLLKQSKDQINETKADLAGQWVAKKLPISTELFEALWSWFEPPLHKNGKEVLEQFNNSAGPGGQWIVLPLEFSQCNRSLSGLARFLISDLETHKILSWGFSIEVSKSRLDFTIHQQKDKRVLLIDSKPILATNHPLLDRIQEIFVSKDSTWEIVLRDSSKHTNGYFVPDPFLKMKETDQYV